MKSGDFDCPRYPSGAVGEEHDLRQIDPRMDHFGRRKQCHYHPRRNLIPNGCRHAREPPVSAVPPEVAVPLDEVELAVPQGLDVLIHGGD